MTFPDLTERYQRRLPTEAANQAVDVQLEQAQAAPMRFMPSLEPDEMEEARQEAYERLGPFILQAHEEHMKRAFADFNALSHAEQYALCVACEPWAVVTPEGEMRPDDWLLELIAISSREAAKWMRRYANLIKEFDPEKDQVLNMFLEAAPEGFGR